MHGARGGAKALVLKHRGLLLRKREGGGEQRGERSRRERSLIVRFNIVRNVNIVSTSSREDEKGRYKRKGGGGRAGRKKKGRKSFEQQ